MPDWITHILVAWTIGTILGFKFKQFNSANIALFIVGSLVPDIIKITMIFDYLGIGLSKFFIPLHTPIGSLIIATIFSFFFKEQKVALFFLIGGMFTHYMLDLLLFDLNGGIYLLYPLSWNQYQLGLITNYDFNITILSIIISFTVYLISNKIHKKQLLKHET